ncbi:fumarate reductase (CoM/CoB) subunit TfrB [Methanobacterium sp. ACI-7]|uniref:fumarate reductase (CoM/CoB) subunit TfrB n=1 Tax=unclassified Methanobacterium TaxID=2627676 RepID=UPI0039C302DA
MIEVKVLRYDPQKEEKPYFQSFSVEKTEKMKVLDALNFINQKYGANIAYRCSCRAGQCGSCALKVNGNVVLACKAEIEDNAIIEPLDFDIIKDLVVDRSEIENKIKEMDLYLKEDVSDEGEVCLQILKPEEYADSKKLRSCIECFSCLSACPTIKEAQEYAGPYFMRYISKFALDPRDEGERAKEGFEEGLYCCTTCGKCKEICPKEISPVGGAIEKLREIACREGIGPLPIHRDVKDLIVKSGRSVEPLEEGFIKAVAGESDDKKANVAFFTGCLVDYRHPEIGFALLKVLEDNEIDIIVPEDQVCCGSPLIRTGQTDAVERLVAQNKEAFEGYDTIVTVCAGCGATLKNDYPKYGAKFNVVDISEFLVENLNTEDMKPLNMRVTYHDPCHLARSQGITKEPREILNKIKGLEFVEMEEPNQCCGAGGGVRAGKPEIAAALGKKKAGMIKKLDVDAVITICPFCQNNIIASLKEEGIDIPVLNILQLLEMAYENK